MTKAGLGTPVSVSYRIADFLNEFVDKLLGASPKCCRNILQHHDYTGKDRIFHVLCDEMYLLFREYAGNAYRKLRWGEQQFLEYLNNFHSNSNDCNEFPIVRNSFGDFLQIKSDGIINRIIASRLQSEYLPQLAEFLRVDYSQKYSRESFKQLLYGDNAEPSTIPARFLITAECFVQRTIISSLSQYTFMGERFVRAKSAFTEDDNDVAVPFNQVLSFSSIDSIRLLEKVDHYFHDYDTTNVTIAAIGAFSDSSQTSKRVKYHIEEYFEKKGGGKHVSVVSLRLKEMTSCSLIFSDEDDACYNIYNIADWKLLCNKYQIVCLLDMGCFYTDTIRYYEIYDQTPFAALKDQLEYINYKKNRDGLDSISFSSFEQLYHRYIQWIETNFYGKRHSFCFDSRLYSIFFTDRWEKICGDSPAELYLYLSRDRDPELYVQNSQKNLCKGEFYNAVEVQTYGLPQKKDLGYDSEGRRKVLFETTASGRRVCVRMWKLIKSLGDNYFSKGFITALSCGSSLGEFFLPEAFTDASCDLDFVHYSQDVSLVFDYSKMDGETRKVDYSICYGKKNMRNDMYSRYIEALVKGMIDLAFVHNTECSSSYTREIIINAILADSFTLEDLMFAYVLHAESFYNPSLDFVYQDCLPHQKRADEDTSAYRQRQLENLAFFDAIDEINRTNRREYYFAEDILQSAIDKTKLEKLNGSNLLDHLGEVCKSFGFTNCALFRCSQKY